MAENSSYLAHLPPVLWSRESDPVQTLGRLLRIFEKILTGIDDGVPLVHGDHRHDGVREMIDRLPHLFDPWRMPPEPALLEYLASWVGLTLNEEWSDYQRRKLILEMVALYRQRGLKQGLFSSHDLHVLTPERPRVAIDDGAALYRGALRHDGAVTLYACAFSQFDPQSQEAFLLHPVAIAVDRDNNYLVLDERGREQKNTWYPALWRVNSLGECLDRNPNGSAVAAAYCDATMTNPTATVIDSRDRYSVLYIGEPKSLSRPGGAVTDIPEAGIVRFALQEGSGDSTRKRTASIVAGPSTKPRFMAIRPVDMVLGADDSYIVLDRGRHDAPAETQIILVREDPLLIEFHRLATVVEPTALAIDDQGRLFVADAQDQNGTTPANLVMVDPTDNWAETLLLPLDPALNPLIYPTGIAFQDPETLLICDSGLRQGFKDFESNRAMSEPAALYRIDLSQSPPTVAKIDTRRRLTSPRKLAIDRTRNLVITDRGESLRLGGDVKREWRLRRNEFGVVVHFSVQRPSSVERRNAIRGWITEVMEENKPGHMSWWMEF